MTAASIGSVAAAPAKDQSIKREIEMRVEFAGQDDEEIEVDIGSGRIGVSVSGNRIVLSPADFARVVAEVKAWHRACDHANAQQEKP